MSYKTEFQANNTDLQSLIDLANALPASENLDVEMTTQDDLIAQISTALVGKSGMSGTCTVNFLRGTGFNRYYIDVTGNSQVSQSTVETKTVMKNSYILSEATEPLTNFSYSGDVTLVTSFVVDTALGCALFYVTGDCSID